MFSIHMWILTMYQHWSFMDIVSYGIIYSPTTLLRLHIGHYFMLRDKNISKRQT